MNLLILYGTTGGHTVRIADRMVDVALSREHQVQVMDCEKLPPRFSARFFDAVIIGSSVHFEKHHPRVIQFVQSHARELVGKPTAFFSVSLAAAAATPEDRVEAVEYVSEFLRQTAWRPARTAIFGGALRYSQYGLLTRAFMKRISKRAGADTDTSQDYDYTDWDSVRHFVDAFLHWAQRELDRGQSARARRSMTAAAGSGVTASDRDPRRGAALPSTRPIPQALATRR